MNVFAEGLSGRPAADIVLISGQERLTAGDFTGIHPSLQPRPDQRGLRLAFSLRSNVRLIEMLCAYDGYAEALLLLDSGLPSEVVAAIAQDMRCDIIVSDRTDIEAAVAPDDILSRPNAAQAPNPGRQRNTEWIMTTSGTTGVPKTVSHSLKSLSRTVRQWDGAGDPPVWGLAYEPTRFAGMQVVLQAIMGGGRLIAPEPDCAKFDDRLRALAAGACTHISGTPTFWRRVLMHSTSAELDLRQITLGGEIAHQAILDGLKARFPMAKITHIYASTEAGVGFSVKDGREGFPLDFVTSGVAGVEMRIEEGHLWIRRAATLAAAAETGSADQLYLDTLDSVMVDGDRVYFLGSGLIAAARR